MAKFAEIFLNWEVMAQYAPKIAEGFWVTVQLALVVVLTGEGEEEVARLDVAGLDPGTAPVPVTVRLPAGVTLVAASPLGIFLTDPAGACVFANPRLGAIWKGPVRLTTLEEGQWRSLVCKDGEVEVEYRDRLYFQFAAGGFDITRNVVAQRGLGLPR